MRNRHYAEFYTHGLVCHEFCLYMDLCVMNFVYTCTYTMYIHVHILCIYMHVHLLT